MSLVSLFSRRTEMEASLPEVRRQFHGCVGRGVHPQLSSPHQVELPHESTHQVTLVWDTCNKVLESKSSQPEMEFIFLWNNNSRVYKRRSFKINLGRYLWPTSDAQPTFFQFPISCPLASLPVGTHCISLQQAGSTRGNQEPSEAALKTELQQVCVQISQILWVGPLRWCSAQGWAPAAPWGTESRHSALTYSPPTPYHFPAPSPSLLT